jgi:hypothetical protein
MDMYGDFETFMHDVGEDRICQMLVFKKMFTPYEQEQKFRDESVYVNDCYDDVKIREVVQLQDDLLIGVQFITDTDDLDDDNYRIQYYKLSDIELAYNPITESEYFDDMPLRGADQYCE